MIGLFWLSKNFYVDYTIVESKLQSLNISDSTVHWMSDFLTNRKQRMKFAYNCFSE